MPYTLKADNNVICQCGCIVNKYYMSKHFKTAKHELEMRDRVVDHNKYINLQINNIYIT